MCNNLKKHSHIVNIGILDYGYWGPNLARNFINVSANVKCVADLSSQRLSAAKNHYPAINTTTNIDDVISDKTIDAELIDLAQKNRKVLMYDHTFLYTGTLKKISQLIQDKHLGSLHD